MANGLTEGAPTGKQYWTHILSCTGKQSAPAFITANPKDPTLTGNTNYAIQAMTLNHWLE